eukprot:4815496-Amphidinium_carterae.3
MAKPFVAAHFPTCLLRGGSNSQRPTSTLFVAAAYTVFQLNFVSLCATFVAPATSGACVYGMSLISTMAATAEFVALLAANSVPQPVVDAVCAGPYHLQNVKQLANAFESIRMCAHHFGIV